MEEGIEEALENARKDYGSYMSGMKARLGAEAAARKAVVNAVEAEYEAVSVRTAASFRAALKAAEGMLAEAEVLVEDPVLQYGDVHSEQKSFKRYDGSSCPFDISVKAFLDVGKGMAGLEINLEDRCRIYDVILAGECLSMDGCRNRMDDGEEFLVKQAVVWLAGKGILNGLIAGCLDFGELRQSLDDAACDMEDYISVWNAAGGCVGEYAAFIAAWLEGSRPEGTEPPDYGTWLSERKHEG